jgi:hypothetical protein
MNFKHYRRPLAIAALSLGAFFVLTAESCDDNQPAPTANQREQAAQAQLTRESQMTVGMPIITNFNQKKQLKAIIEAFDQPNLITYSYTQAAYTGKLTPLCRSQGYGFNEATQFTNPQQIEWREYGQGGLASGVVGQADPTGLYSPNTSEGTLLMCLTVAGKVLPVRSEPSIVTLPVPYDQLDRTGM